MDLFVEMIAHGVKGIHIPPPLSSRVGYPTVLVTYSTVYLGWTVPQPLGVGLRGGVSEEFIKTENKRGKTVTSSYLEGLDTRDGTGSRPHLFTNWVE